MGVGAAIQSPLHSLTCLFSKEVLGPAVCKALFWAVGAPQPSEQTSCPHRADIVAGKFRKEMPHSTAGATSPLEKNRPTEGNRGCEGEGVLGYRVMHSLHR